MTSPDTKPEEKPEENGNNKKEEEQSSDAEQNEDKKNVEEMEGVDKPRALHRTTSIFLRNLAPTITKAEVEAMCKRYPGFLRAAISVPTRLGDFRKERKDQGDLLQLQQHSASRLRVGSDRQP